MFDFLDVINSTFGLTQCYNFGVVFCFYFCISIKLIGVCVSISVSHIYKKLLL